MLTVQLSARFTSDRERRLWLWTLAVVVAIYSTLGLARTVAGELRNRELLDTVFVWCTVLILAATVAVALKIRPGGAEIGVAFGVVAVYLMIFVRMAIPEERTHLVEYGVVAIFIYEALKERASHGRPVRLPAVVALVAATLIGVVDEGIQLLLPSRVFDPADIFVNFVSALMAILATLALSRARRLRPDR
ncbi:MAG: VanZ family protein [Acidimicrobiia bacterium]|nr:VanZ family protein [Acidimicrobiia bacterium]